MNAQVGDKILFKSEKKSYTVMACDERFIVCTKPFNVKKTVLYTIIDINRNVRGTENLIFCMGFETNDDCQEALKRLQLGESEVSYRNYVKLDIVKIEKFKN